MTVPSPIALLQFDAEPGPYLDALIAGSQMARRRRYGLTASMCSPSLVGKTQSKRLIYSALSARLMFDEHELALENRRGNGHVSAMGGSI